MFTHCLPGQSRASVAASSASTLAVWWLAHSSNTFIPPACLKQSPMKPFIGVSLAAALFLSSSYSKTVGGGFACGTEAATWVEMRLTWGYLWTGTQDSKNFIFAFYGLTACNPHWGRKCVGGGERRERKTQAEGIPQARLSLLWVRCHWMM